MAKNMDHNAKAKMSAPKIGLIMTTALAGVTLSGCTTTAAAPAGTSFAKAQVALENGQASKAISHAEAAVLAEPRNAGYRAVLGAAYMGAGRFEAAATSFNDALELGDNDARTVLSYALAKTALGDNGAALAKLSDYQGYIGAADLGLAMALAGQPERGVHILTNALRGGDNTAKVRQNLAYTYALAGNWRAARVMAAEDVPADQLDARLSDWAATARPEDHRVRVANLLNVTPASDGGQPSHLALANFPSQKTMVAEAAAQAPAQPVAKPRVAAVAVPKPAPTTAPKVARATVSKPVVQQVAKPAVKPVMTPAAQRVAAAPVAKPVAKPAVAPAPRPAAKPVSTASSRFVSKPMVQNVPAKAAAKPAPAVPTRVASSASQRRMAVATGTSDTHLVQLGSFSTRAVAEARWNDLQKKFPDLAGRDVVITEANVKGKTFFRVAAAGFGAKSAKSMCGTAKAKGLGCFAYAASNPPAGAVDRGVRIAARTR